MTVYIANILDAILTLTWVKLKVADEANPIMAALLETDPLTFFLVKVAAVTIACVILWTLRYHPLSKWIALSSALLYSGIIAWHIIGSYHANILVIPTLSDIKEAAGLASDALSSYTSQIIDEISRRL